MTRFTVISILLFVVFVAFTPPAFPAPPASPALAGQVSFEEAVRQLSSPDANVRLRTVQILNSGAYPEAAIPLASVVTDPDDSVQLEAIAGELNLFLADKVVTKRRVALVVEVRNSISAEAVFTQGILALNANPVPIEVLTALRAASRDANTRVAVEALYSFGSLAGEVSGTTRRELLRASAPELAGMVGASDLTIRLAAIRVISHVFALRPTDAPVDETLGDAVIVAFNDRNQTIQLAAMDAIGALRYERAVQALLDLVQYHRRNPIGVAALEALARIGHGAAAALFRTELTAGNRTTKISAIEGLARAGDRSAVAAIRSAVARDLNDAVVLAERFAFVLLDNAPLDALFVALGKSGTHDQAFRYLMELAPGRLSSFGVQAKDGDAKRRADVALILAVSGDAAALPIVEPMTHDADPNVVRAADRAVARLRRAS